MSSDAAAAAAAAAPAATGNGGDNKKDKAADKKKRTKTEVRATLDSFLHSFQANSPIFPDDGWGRVYTCKTSDSLMDAMQQLVKHKISAMPVRDAADPNGTPVAWFTTLDVVHYLIDHVSEDELGSADGYRLHFGEAIDKLAPVTVGEVAARKLHDRFVRVLADSTLYDALGAMLDTYAHRVCVVDNDGRLVSVLSQSRFLQFLQPMLDDELCALSIGQMHVASMGEVIAVSARTSLFRAFKILHDINVSGIAVIDTTDAARAGGGAAAAVAAAALDGGPLASGPSLARGLGRFVGKISANDLKGAADLQLYQTAGDYIARSNHENHQKPETLTVRRSDSFGELVSRFVSTGAHRLFLVDRDMRVLGIVTLHGALAAIWRHYHLDPTELFETRM